MKNLCATFLVLGLVLVLVQTPGPSEALKIKKVKKAIKDAKKLSKKYGYLLASRNKKLYAIPFPMPLPVFVKRQHIYTQVPIIPRYVQHPQPYGAQMAEASMYEPVISMQTSALSSHYGMPNESNPQGQRKKKNAPSSHSSLSSPTSSSSDQQESLYAIGGFAGTSSSSTAKYLSQLANILGQSAAAFGGATGNSNRELFAKLLSGQAKVLPPSSLISAIKGPSMTALKYQQQQQAGGASKEQDQKTKNEHAWGSSDENNYNSQESSGGGAAGDTNKKPYKSSSSPAPQYDTNRPSASELHKSRHRAPLTAGRLPYKSLAGARRPAGEAAMMSAPMAAAAATAQEPGEAPRIPMGQLLAANQYLALLESQANQFDQMESQSSEPNELAANLNLQNQQSQTDEEQTGASDQSQLMDRRRLLLKLALLKERQEAERLLQSRMVLARAKQINQQLGQLPVASQQQAAQQMMNHYREQQAAQQLQQMRYLQLLHQQHRRHQHPHPQQQMQLNTINSQY